MKLHYMLFASACLIITLIIVGFIVLFTVDERPSDSAKVNEHLLFCNIESYFSWFHKVPLN